MKRLLILFFFLSSSLQAKSLASFFDEYRNGKEVSDELKGKAQDYYYVFVSGFLNEKTPFYWDDIVTKLKRLGVKDEEILFIDPPSNKTIEQNTEVIHDEFTNIKISKPIIMIAHSKGAVETFNFVWNFPELVKEKVHSAIFIQGAFGGSYVADTFVTGKLDFDSKISMLDQIIMQAQFKLNEFILEGYRTGLQDLTIASRLKWRMEIFAKKRPLHDELRNKLVFISSTEETDRVSLYLRNAGRYLSAYQGPNDGLLLANAQHLPFGLHEEVKADHADFVLKFFTKHSERFRHAFTVGLLHWLHQHEIL